MAKQTMTREHVEAVQRRRASGGHGPHADRRWRRARTRSGVLRRELDQQ